MGIIVGGVKAPEVKILVNDEVVNETVQIEDVVVSEGSGDSEPSVVEEEASEKKVQRRRKSKK